MKSLWFILALIIMSFMQINAQSFEKGNHGINFGIGLGNGYHGSGYSFAFGVNGSYEMGIVEVPMGTQLTGVVGVGALVGVSFSSFAYSYWTGGNYNYTDFVFAARGSYHFIFHDKLDPYAGITLGFWGSSYKWKGSGQAPVYESSTGKFRPGIFAGARYLFTDNLGVYAEVGYLLNFLNIGVTYRID
ncbi:MAG: hypothetical protein R6W71_08910 [Bacteroidales bacterium]|jgi:hypothetical protein